MNEEIVGICSFTVLLLVLPCICLWGIWTEYQREKSRWWVYALGLFFLLFYTWVAASLLAALRGIAPFELFNEERIFFWSLVEKLLGKTEDLLETVRMLQPRLGEVEAHIQTVCGTFRKSGIIFMTVGGIFLAAALLMMMGAFRKIKNACFLLILFLACALVALGWGCHQYHFHTVLYRKLTAYMRIQYSQLVDYAAAGQRKLQSNQSIKTFIPQYLKATPKVFCENWQKLEEGFFKKK